MKFRKFFISCGGAVAATVLLFNGSVNAENGNWIERSQIFHFPGTAKGEPFQIKRHKIAVWNGQDEQDLDFSWEPVSPPGIASDGKLNGRGELTWRPTGTPDYNLKDRYSVYIGNLLNGKRHGQGQYRRHDGLFYVGGWKGDLFDGEGRLTLTNGDVYSGQFRTGEFHGTGQQTLHNGEVYEGGFKNGVRHGEARILTADGDILATRWLDGEQVFMKTVSKAQAEHGPEVHLTAGSGSGHADQIDIGFSVNQEMNQKFGSAGGVSYLHQVDQEGIDVFPFDDEFLAHWDGDGQIWRYQVPENANSVFMNSSFTGKNGFKFSLKKMVFEVTESTPFNKPVLETGSNRGCVHFRPDFHFKNHGWGSVENASVEFSFGNEDGSRKSNRVHKVNIGSFERGADVVIRDAFAAMGADVSSLDHESMPVCPTFDQADSCLKTGMPELPLGELSDYVFPSWFDAQVNVYGKIKYQWTTHSGEKKTVSEAFSTPITVSTLTFDQSVSECGDLPFFLPEPPRVFKVELPSNRKSYQIVYDLNIAPDSRVGGVLDISSDRSSVHKFRFGGEFADGSKKMSKPINLYYYKPRFFSYEDEKFINQVDLPMCHIKPGASC
ncbi:MORN repeat-containing protein [Roseibium sp. SCP14]|uniref:MORN repeat-containing protein n=1 Tax=Roseibium sp. SCP14 TaxID=3141375 RepID=UPI00333DDDE4